MVGVSYHELQASSNARTGSRPRHSAGQRKQFLVICVLGAAFAANAFINGGIFENVVIKDDGIYPGGEFVYKIIEDKDYATTSGVWRLVTNDLQPPIEESLDLNNNNSSKGEKENFDSSLYAVYVDNLEKGQGRYFNGILLENSQKALKKRLLDKNENIPFVKDVEQDFEEFFLKLRYQVGDLPSVRSIVATFPFTGGFISGLMHNYKVFPALVKYARNNLDPKMKVVISSNCDIELKVCKHYIPMTQSKKFLLGHPDTEEYLNAKPKEELDLATLLKGVKKLLKF